MTLIELYYLLRYGYWKWGWGIWKHKPMFGFVYVYYDGHNLSFNLYKFWISVSTCDWDDE